MHDLTINTSPKAKLKLESYPLKPREKLYYLRGLIFEAASEIEAIEKLEETLKWGELSYIVASGSTIRIDWKPKIPSQYAMYFNCHTSLVYRFRLMYRDLFRYEANRAIVFDLSDTIPEHALKSCIKMALTYHSLIKKSLF